MLVRFVKTALYASKLFFRIKYLLWKKLKKTILFLQSPIFSGTFREDRQVFSAGLPYVPTLFFRGTLKSYDFTIFQDSRKLPLFFQGTFRQGIENQTPRLRKTFFENTRFIQKIESPNTFRFYQVNCHKFHGKSRQGCPKCLSCFQTEALREKISLETKTFVDLVAIRRKSSGLTVKTSWLVCQNCSIHVHRKFLRKISHLENFIVRKPVQTLWGKLSGYWMNFCGQNG